MSFEKTNPFNDPNNIQTVKRLYVFFIIACIFFAILIARLAYMQIYQYPYWKQRSEGNRIRLVPKAASRGFIYDSKSKVMATNRLSYSVIVYPMKMEKERINKSLGQLEQILGMPAKKIEQKLLKTGFHSAYPVYLMHNANEEVMAKILENQAALPGVEIVQTFIRYYPNKHSASHVLGYSREITDEELKDVFNKDYTMGDIIGKTGIEQKFDTELRGKAGGSYIEVDATGKPIRAIKSEKPKQGNSVQLTIDSDVQRVAEKVLANKKGAIVVINPNTGEIIALASKPDFDPNMFSDSVSEEEWVKLQKSADHPFCNRAVTAYPPGSIFKIVTSVAAMEKGKLDEFRTFYSSGSLKIGNRLKYDWNRSGFGIVDIKKALAYSIDTVFYQLGIELGIYPIKMYANLFNLGVLTGIELPGELAGTIPDENWKQQFLNEPWYPGDSANASIGQGFVQASPLQGAIMISAIANGGKVLQPFLVRSIRDPSGKLLKNCVPQQIRRLPVSQHTIDVVRRGLEGTVQYGTATALQIGVPVAAKTGSAEDPPRQRTHAWVVAYAPADNPRVAMCMFLEQGGSGGHDAAPLAKIVLKEALGLNKKTVSGNNKEKEESQKVKKTEEPKPDE